MRKGTATTAQIEDFVAFEGEFSVEVRNATTGDKRFAIKPQDVHVLALGPYADIVYTADEQHLVAHPETRGVKRVPIEDELISLHAAGDALYSVTAFGTVTTHDPQSLEARAEFELNPAEDELIAVAWARNGRKLVMVDGEDFGLFERRADTWICKELFEHEGEGRCAALADDGAWALLGVESEVLKYDFSGSEEPDVVFDAGDDAVIIGLAVAPEADEFLVVTAKAGSSKPSAVHRRSLDGKSLMLPETRQGVPKAVAYGIQGQRILDRIGELCCATEAGDWVIPEAKTNDWAALRPKEVLKPMRSQVRPGIQPLPKFYWFLKKEEAAWARDRVGGETVVGLQEDWPECGRCGNPLSVLATVEADPEQLPLKKAKGLAAFLCLAGEGCSALDPSCSHVAFLSGTNKVAMPEDRNEFTVVLEEASARRKADEKTHEAMAWRFTEPEEQACEECDELLEFAFAFDDVELEDDLLHEFGDQLVVLYCKDECEGRMISLNE